MAIGDQDDLERRLKRVLPSWFGDDFPVLSSLIAGIASALSFIYGLIVYATMQTRILTATGGFLDLIAADFFGTNLRRLPNQSDTNFRAAIVANLFRERVTRAGLIRVITDLTGNVPTVFEPRRPLDTGVYGGPYIGYGLAGGYGSVLLPYQAFVTVRRPLGNGIANVSGYGISTGGYGQASQLEYASLDMAANALSDADIYAAIDAVEPAATIVWTRITN